LEAIYERREAMAGFYMGIGKAMVVMICCMIAVVAMVTMFSIAQKDKSTSDVYTNESTINSTTQLTQTVTSSGTNFMMSMILITAILAFGAVIIVFRKK
jgi:ABC-type transport system involved in multi-copper enzyme maturation permease subunit